jgi:RNA polymerase sigma-70 factor (ECF subfamily)
MQMQLMSEANVSMEAGSAVKAMPDFAEREIVAAAISGCAGAFEQIVKKYEARVFRLAHSMTRRHEDAEEIAQNAFVQVFKNISRFRGDSSFHTWLTRITINEALMKIRRRRTNEVSIDDLDGAEEGFSFHEIEAHGPTPEQRYSQTELREILGAIMAKLPQSYRPIFQLRDVEGFSTGETAKILGLTPGTVKTRLRRARSLMRDSLNEHFKRSRRRRRVVSKSQIRGEVMVALGINGGTPWPPRPSTTAAASIS